MTNLTLILSDDEALRLREAAQALGARPEDLAAEAVRQSLADDADWVEAVDAGLADMDAGRGVSLEAYGAEMDAFLAALEAKKA